MKTGKIKKIYILHGWAYTTERWQPLVELLQSNNYEVNLLKIPGLTAPLNEVWNLDNYVDWLEKILQREKGKVVLLGHSNGGRIGLVYASKYPERIERLILIDSGGVYHNELPIRIKRFVFVLLAKMGRKFTNSEFLRRALYKLTRESDYERANPIMRKTMTNLITADVRAFFNRIKIPVMIIWGENDNITPLSDGRIMQRGIQNSGFYIVRGAKHSPMFSHVEEVVRVILKELRK